MRALTLFLLIFLTACATPPDTAPPTSARLEAVKAQREMLVKAEMELAGYEYGTPAFIRIFKEEAMMELWLRQRLTPEYTLYRAYPICNFSGALGPKIMEGDGQAPEGFYSISAQQMNPWSQYHLSFNLGFPNEYDKAMHRTGSALMIHGGCKSIGCYALTDDQVEEAYLLTEASILGGANVPVHIFPFRPTVQNLFAHRDDPWTPFWINLKQGYDAFETTKIPPDVEVRSGQGGPVYVFERPTLPLVKTLGF